MTRIGLRAAGHPGFAWSTAAALPRGLSPTDAPLPTATRMASPTELPRWWVVLSSVPWRRRPAMRSSSARAKRSSSKHESCGDCRPRGVGEYIRAERVAQAVTGEKIMASVAHSGRCVGHRAEEALHTRPHGRPLAGDIARRCRVRRSTLSPGDPVRPGRAPRPARGR